MAIGTGRRDQQIQDGDGAVLVLLRSKFQHPKSYAATPTFNPTQANKNQSWKKDQKIESELATNQTKQNMYSKSTISPTYRDVYELMLFLIIVSTEKSFLNG